MIFFFFFIYSDGYERPLSSTEHINGVKKFVNKVNVIRASIGHVVGIFYFMFYIKTSLFFFFFNNI